MTLCPHCFIDSATLVAQADMIQKLEHENADLRSKRTLPEADISVVAPGTLGMTPQLTRMLSLLLVRERVRNEELALAAGTEAADEKALVKVQVCRLRQKLKPLGLSIDTIWGWGYYIPREQRAGAMEKLAA